MSKRGEKTITCEVLRKSSLAKALRTISATLNDAAAEPPRGWVYRFFFLGVDVSKFGAVFKYRTWLEVEGGD